MPIWGGECAEQYKKIDRLDLDLLFQEIIASFGPTTASVVDYGCGQGLLLRELEQRGFQELYGFDHSLAMVEEAKQNVGETTNLRAVDSTEMPLENESVDAVVTNLVLMMNPTKEDIGRMFRESYRVLRKGGIRIDVITHPVFYTEEFRAYQNLVPEDCMYFDEELPYEFVLKQRDGSLISNEDFIDYHYTLDSYVNFFLEAGFKLTGFKEINVLGEKVPPYLLLKGKK